MAEQILERELALARRIAEQVAAEGGRVYYVGGCVRDRLRGVEVKDLDIEVHGLAPERLALLLDQLGTRLEMGASFGIWMLQGYALDIALPRREEAIGHGHRDFTVSIDPWLGPERAAERRDFTVNAMLQDVLSGALLDPFGGQADLAARSLRYVRAERFIEDPLRVLRGAQFAARFQFHLSPETLELCRKMDLSSLSRERIWGELRKALLQAAEPSIFWQVLRETKQLDIWFPELAALIGLSQDPHFHPEGDVWTHTLLVLDAAVSWREKEERPLSLMLAALCHDFGKAVCTEQIEGIWHAYQHEKFGLPLVRHFLERLGCDRRTLNDVLNLVDLHMRPHQMVAAGSRLKKSNALFDEAGLPETLCHLALADSLGSLKSCDWVQEERLFLQTRLAAFRELQQQGEVQGRDLLAAGLPAGPDLGEILAYTHKLHLAGIPREAALKQGLAYWKKNQKKPGKQGLPG